MDERERKERAEFWARLASVAALDELAPAEHTRLVATFERMLAIATDYVDMTAARKDVTAAVSRMRAEVGRHAHERGGRYGYREQVEEQLTTAHKIAREKLLPLVQGRGVLVHLEQDAKWSISTDGDFVEIATARNMAMKLLGVLADVLRRSRHLFGACPQCGAVFVRIRRQRYCSPNCNAKALAESRKEEKAQYMRVYRKRQHAKKHKAKKGA